MRKDTYSNVSLNELGNELINQLAKRDDPFHTALIVFPSLKMEQWFKAYWLANKNEVLMNIECKNINSFLFESIYTNDTPYSLAKSVDVRDVIIKFLSLPGNKIFVDYIYDIKDDGSSSLNSVKLFDLADLLSKIFSEYDQDMFFVTGEQKVIYDYVNEELKKVNKATLRYKFEIKDSFKKYDEVIFFGINKLTKLQERIIEEFEKEADTYMYLLINDSEFDEPKFEVTAAASILREVEYVHSTIANLLKDKDNKFSDFLVLSTDINKYENVISRVFKQDREQFYDIPFSILGSKKDNGDVTVVLNKLLEILNKGFFTRLDLFDVINNPLIKKVRNIDDEEIENWMKSIVELNVYRQHNGVDDWEYARKRLILSKLSDINNVDNNIVNLGDGDHLPYTNIGFSDDSIVKFINIIDDLRSWLDVLSKIKTLDKDSLVLVKTELDKWFSILNDDDLETNILYKPVLKELDNWTSLDITDNVPLYTLFYSLLEASKIRVSTSGALFTQGITFTNFDENNILSAKYIFFLGMDSKSIPIVPVKNELDLRLDNKNALDEIKDSFYKQYKNANECFYMSFINKNLKTDEDYYPSSLILEFFKKILPPNTKLEDFMDNYFKTHEIGVDEKRSWKELFTKREYKNKEYYYGLFNDNGEPDDIDKHPHELLKKVSVSNIADYIKEPLLFKAKQLFGRNDELDDNIKDEYEPFGVDALTKSILSSDLAIEILKEVAQVRDSGLPVDLDSIANKRKQSLKEKYNLEHRLPDICDELNDSAFNVIFSTAVSIANVIYQEYNNFEVRYFDDLELVTDKGDSWLLTCNKAVVVVDDDLTKTYLEVKNEGKYLDDLLFLYAASLRHIAELQGDATYTVNLDRRKIFVSFEVTPNKAKEVLNAFYYLVNDFEENYFLLLSILKEKDYSFDDLRDLLGRNAPRPWNYFDDRILFDIETQLGYKEETFKKDMRDRFDKILTLILFEIVPDLKLMYEEDEESE